MPKIVYDRNDELIVPCRGCGAKIWFTVSKKTGKRIPVTAETGEPHWATCPNAADFRTRKTGPGQNRQVKWKKKPESN